MDLGLHHFMVSDHVHKFEMDLDFQHHMTGLTTIHPLLLKYYFSNIFTLLKDIPTIKVKVN
jgi:hypothetical protein